MTLIVATGGIQPAQSGWNLLISALPFIVSLAGIAMPIIFEYVKRQADIKLRRAELEYASIELAFSNFMEALGVMVNNRTSDSLDRLNTSAYKAMLFADGELYHCITQLIALAGKISDPVTLISYPSFHECLSLMQTKLLDAKAKIPTSKRHKKKNEPKGGEEG